MGFLPLMTPSEIAAAASRGAVVLLPIGTVDAQGPHMPLGYDYLVAEELARRACELTGDVWTAPLCYGVSEALVAFPGTISVSVDTLRDLVRSVVGSLLSHGFEHVVLVTNHNPNMHAVEQACRDIRRDTGVLVPSVMPSVLALEIAMRVVGMGPQSSGHGADPHASLVRFILPEAYRSDLAAAMPLKTLGPYEIVSPFAIRHEGIAVSMFLNLEDLSDTGSWGDPTHASEETGERILDGMVEHLASFLRSFRHFDVRRASLLDGQA